MPDRTLMIHMTEGSWPASRESRDTPFDRPSNSRPLATVVVHTDSVVEAGVTSTIEFLDRLCRLSELGWREQLVNVLFLPTAKEDALRVLESYHKASNYEHQPGGVALQYGPEDRMGWVSGCPENMAFLPAVQESAVLWVDLAIATAYRCDYFVVGGRDPLHQDRRVGKSEGHPYRVLGPSEFLDTVRLLLTSNSQFYVSPGYLVNEGIYYRYRMIRLFNEAFMARAGVYADPGRQPEIADQFDSLEIRTTHMCRAVDRVAHYSMRRPNNDVGDWGLYHCAYLVMLGTGAFDDLAWLVNLHYGLGIARGALTLRPDTRNSKRLLSAIQIRNEPLYEYLNETGTLRALKAIYPLRDAVQHRRFLGGLRYQNARIGLDTNLFKATESELKEIIELWGGTGTEWGVMFGHDGWYGVDPKVFADKLLAEVAKVVNGFMPWITWYNRERLDVAGLAKLDSLKKDLETKPWAILSMPTEPLYF